MMRALTLALVLAGFALSGCKQEPAGERVARARIDGEAAATAPVPAPTPTATPTIASQVESVCRSIIFENTSLTHCLAIPSRHHIVTALAPEGGEPYRSLTGLAANLDESTVVFAMNAGIFDSAGEPVGYFVENSQRLHNLNTATGAGNFYMKPNGVFFGSGDKWEIRTTKDFLANVTERPEFGTQSGPMLVIQGKLAPGISNDGPSRLVRNAVGVDARGRAHFVISNAPVSFGKIARFFRDELHAENALFLDANVSQLWNPATDRLDTGEPIGPILIVERKEPSQ